MRDEWGPGGLLVLLLAQPYEKSSLSAVINIVVILVGVGNEWLQVLP